MPTPIDGPPPLDIRRQVEVLNRHGVRFLVVGGANVVAQGASHLTTDLDVLPVSDADNLARLGSAMEELVATPDTPRGLPDTPVGRRLRRRRRAIIEAAERRGATNVRVFGSSARGTDTEASDVDLLVDLSPDVGIISLIGLEREIAEILGREVDVVPAANLKTEVAARAFAEAIPL